MQQKSPWILTALILVATLAVGSSAWAAAGSNAAAQANSANGGISRCEQSKQGQALIDCIGDTMDRLSSGIDTGDVKRFAPQLVSAVGQAADIRGKPKAEAVRVLNRVLAITRSLAAKDSHNLGRGFNAIEGVFTHAISAIERKG